MELISKENLIHKHKELIQLIYAYDYYTSVFELTQELYPIDFSTIGGIYEFWHDFLYMLPDTPGIERDPFKHICDMARVI